MNIEIASENYIFHNCSVADIRVEQILRNPSELLDTTVTNANFHAVRVHRGGDSLKQAGAFQSILSYGYRVITQY